MKNNSYHSCSYCKRTILSRYKKTHTCSSEGNLAQVRKLVGETTGWITNYSGGN